MGIIFTSPLPCGPPQFHIAVAPCLAIVEVIYKASPSATQVVGGDILTLFRALWLSERMRRSSSGLVNWSAISIAANSGRRELVPSSSLPTLI